MTRSLQAIVAVLPELKATRPHAVPTPSSQEREYINGSQTLGTDLIKSTLERGRDSPKDGSGRWPGRRAERRGHGARS